MATWVVGAVLWWGTGAAVAQSDSETDIAVFKLAASAEHRGLADRLTDKIRDEVAGEANYKLVNKDPVAVSDVIVVLGCNSPTATCLKKAADQFGAKLLVFGDLEATETGQRATVKLFDASTGRYVRSFSHVLGDGPPYDGFGGEVRKLLQTGEARKASRLHVSATVAEATVLLDGRKVGQTPVTLKGVEKGRHRIVIEHPDYESWETQVDVNEGSRVRIRAPMEREKKVDEKPAETPEEELPAVARSSEGAGESAGDSESMGGGAADDSAGAVEPPGTTGRSTFNAVGPWIALGAGAASLGGSLVAWLQVTKAEDDLKAWRNDEQNWQRTQMVGDKCVGEECSIISRGERAETLHRVFLGVGGVGVVGGLVWLALRKGPDARETSRFQMTFGARHVGARWRW